MSQHYYLYDHYGYQTQQDHQGIDDQFNDGLFSSVVRGSARMQRTRHAPSTSESRRWVQYGDQPTLTLSDDQDPIRGTGASNIYVHRNHRRRWA